MAFIAEKLHIIYAIITTKYCNKGHYFFTKMKPLNHRDNISFHYNQEVIIMGKSKSFAEQIEELQIASERVVEYDKLFSKTCQSNFNRTAKNITKMLENSNATCSQFETKIREFYNLKSDKDLEDFLTIFCTETSRNFYKNKLENEKITTSEQG